MSKTHVPLGQVRDNPHQVRIGTGDLDNLAQSVLAHGLRQLPEARLLVEGEHWTGSYSQHTKQVDSEWRLTDGVAELASGHRRAAAVQLLNDDDTVSKAQLTSVGLVPGYLPVDLQRLTDEEMLDVGTAENLDRQDLSPIEEARLIQEHVNAGRNLSAIAPHFGDRSESWVSNRKRLLELPVFVQKHVHEGEISVRQAQALARGYGVDIDVTPDGLVEKALRGADSDWLRDEVDAFVERVEENGESFSPDVGTTHPKARAPARSDSTTNEDVKDDDSDRNRTEASASDGGSDAGARTQEDLRSDDGGGPERASSEDSASRPSVDEEGREKSAGKADVVSGDGAPSSDSSTDHSAHLPMVIDAVEADGHDWKLQSLDEGYYQGTVQNGGTAHMAEGSTPAEALQSAWHSAQDVDVGTVDAGQIDVLLAAGEDMWDAGAAAAASIASLYVAYRVANERQERWRREEIAQEMHEREETVTEEDFPCEVWEDVQAEVKRRLQPQEA